MTGNTLTANPINGTNAYVGNPFGSSQQGFWGNVNGFGGNTPFGFGNPVFQTPISNTINPFQTFTSQYAGQTIPQNGFVGQPSYPLQGGFGINPQFGFQGNLGVSPQLRFQGGFGISPQAGFQGGLGINPQFGFQGVLNTILQTTPPQVLPFVLNALACQQACQQVLAQNPQAIQGIQPQSITQPFLGFGTTNQGLTGFGGNVNHLGVTPNAFVGVQPQWLGQGCVGCQPGTQQWGVTGPQNSFGQVQPQQPWFNNTFGTW